MKQLFKLQEHFWEDLNVMDISFDYFPSYIEDSTIVHKMNTAMYMEVKIYGTYVMFIFSDMNDNCELFINKELHNFKNIKKAIQFLIKEIEYERVESKF